MNWTERIGIEGAETMIAFLSKEFKVKRPKIKKGRIGYSSRGNSGHYVPGRKKQSICLGPNCTPWLVAHEFAHHLNYLTNRSEYTVSRRKEPHSQSFYYNLRRIIAVVGDADQYPWNKEYKQLFRWAKKDGIFLLTPSQPISTMFVSEISDGDKHVHTEIA